MAFRLKLAGAAAAILALVGLSAPAHAQFGGILRNLPRAAASAATDTSSSADGCPQGRSRNAGSRVAGGVLGQVARNAAYDAGISSWVPIPDVADQLTSAIACRLDPEEQKQAAQATLDATRSLSESEDGAQVGDSASWTSATRENVSGSSTVLAREDASSGSECITVSDVIIVNGEETRADKRMCRRPPAARYALAA
jgi:hypothetical protein